MLLPTNTSRNGVKMCPTDEIIGNYAIKNPRISIAYKTLIIASLNPNFIPSDPKMILHKIYTLPWQPFSVNEFPIKDCCVIFNMNIYVSIEDYSTIV